MLLLNSAVRLLACSSSVRTNCTPRSWARKKCWRLGKQYRYETLYSRRHTCLRCIRACSALEALRNALYKCSTYLLTYLLPECTGSCGYSCQVLSGVTVSVLLRIKSSKIITTTVVLIIVVIVNVVISLSTSEDSFRCLSCLSLEWWVFSFFEFSVSFCFSTFCRRPFVDWKFAARSHMSPYLP